MKNKLSKQILHEVEKHIEDIDRLQFGELTLIIQDNRLVRWEMQQSYKVTDPNNGRSRP